MTELVAPRAVARLIGVAPDGRTALALRLLGMRGLGIFARPRRAGPLWSRVAGDAMDLGLLLWALRAKRTSAQRLGAAIAAVAGVTLLDVFASARQQKLLREARRPIKRTIAINRTPAEVYAKWRVLEDQPAWMRWLESVRSFEDGRSRWVATMPTGHSCEWEAVITEDIPGRAISWRAIGGVDLRGTVMFADLPGSRGTLVTWTMTVGAPLADIIMGAQMQSDLRRFKQVIESGEVVGLRPGPHATQPSAREEVRDAR